MDASPPIFNLVIQTILIFMRSQSPMVGSGTQRVTYCTGVLPDSRTGLPARYFLALTSHVSVSLDFEEWGTNGEGLVYKLNLEPSYTVLGVERSVGMCLMKRSARQGTYGCNDRFDFFLLTYSHSTGHLDTDFFVLDRAHSLALLCWSS